LILITVYISQTWEEKYRTKRKTKDLDEIQDDMKPGKVIVDY